MDEDVLINGVTLKLEEHTGRMGNKFTIIVATFETSGELELSDDSGKLLAQFSNRDGGMDWSNGWCYSLLMEDAVGAELRHGPYNHTDAYLPHHLLDRINSGETVVLD